MKAIYDSKITVKGFLWAIIYLLIGIDFFRTAIQAGKGIADPNQMMVYTIFLGVMSLSLSLKAFMEGLK